MRLLLLLGVLVSLALSAAGSAGSAGSPVRWMVTDLGTLGGAGSDAAAINERGQVVGKSDTAQKRNGFAIRHAFLWTNGTMRDLGTLGGSDSEAVAINNRGEVVGTSDTARKRQDGYPIRRAFLWTNGKMRDLGTLGGSDSEAVAINNRGEVVGTSDTSRRNQDGYPIKRAFLWANGKMRDLGTLGERDGGSRGVAINGAGQVIGTSDTTDPYNNNEAFVWEHGSLRDLGLFGAVAINEQGQVLGNEGLWADGRTHGLGGMALDLNDLGDAVGYCIEWLPDNSTQVARPCLWQHDGTDRDLGILRRGDRGRALAVNNQTQIVGRTGIGPPSGKSHAFLWEHGRLTDLGGLRTSDWSEASAITNGGVILGDSKPTSDAPGHAVLWTRPSAD